MWCARLQLVKDRVADALRITAQIRIPEAQRLDAARFQNFFPFLVVFALVRKTVLAAVQFDVQLRLLAKEIQRVNSHWMLTAKLVMAETAVAQPAPHQLFRPCLFLAELTGAFNAGHDL